MNNIYWLGFLKISKKTWKELDSIFLNADTIFYTASTIKIVLAWLFYENCRSELHKITKIKNKDKFIWWILYNIKWKTEISYEILIHLMLTISDNTATNSIFDKLTSELWDLTTYVSKKFNIKNTKILDLSKQNNSKHIIWSWKSTPQEFSQLLKYFLFDATYAKKIRDIMTNQYITWRWLRYFDKNNFESIWNKSWQLDDMINDCWFIENKKEIFLYNIFMKVPKKSEYEYQVENKYYKKIWKIILDSFKKTKNKKNKA
jgi:beta-lactamase class A